MAPHYDFYNVERTIDTGGAIGLLVGVFLLYLIPALIAWWRQHPQTMPIFLTNLLFGWTLVGWFIALIWSSSAVR